MANIGLTPEISALNSEISASKPRNLCSKTWNLNPRLEARNRKIQFVPLPWQSAYKQDRKEGIMHLIGASVSEPSSRRNQMRFSTSCRQNSTGKRAKGFDSGRCQFTPVVASSGYTITIKVGRGGAAFQVLLYSPFSVLFYSLWYWKLVLLCSL